MRRAARSVVLEARRVARDRRKKPPFRVKWLGGPIGRRATSLFIPVFMERPWRRSEGDCERMQIWNSFRSMPLTSRLGMLAEFDYPQTAVNVSRCGDMGIAVGGGRYVRNVASVRVCGCTGISDGRQYSQTAANVNHCGGMGIAVGRRYVQNVANIRVCGRMGIVG